MCLKKGSLITSNIFQSCFWTERCPEGYTEKVGNVLGNYLQEGIWASLNQCAAKCTNHPECNSFEHDTKNICNLNKDRDPDGPSLPGFIFCSKKGKILLDQKAILV